MRIVISGATSMIGSALTNALIERNHEVIAIVRNGSNKISCLKDSDNLSIIECDMNNYHSLSNKIENVDVAVSIAWNGTRGADRNNTQLQEENYKNSMDFLKVVLKNGCRKFLTAGSQAEYGLWSKEEKLTENEVPHPNTEYGKYKLKFYEEAKEYCEQNSCFLIEPRFFSLYGPADYEGTLVISMLRKMLNNDPCELTECTQLWDFLYIDDAIEGLIKLIEDICDPGIYNFGSGYSAPLKEFVDEMYEITSSTSNLSYGKVTYPMTGVINVNPDVSKLKAIGWNPKNTFKDGILSIVKLIIIDNIVNS